MNEKKKNNKLILIIGPSGVGKTSIMKVLKKDLPKTHFAKSATTRKIRPGESKNSYHFLTENEFNNSIKKEEFLEWGRTHGKANYATVKNEVIPYLDKGRNVVSEIDTSGVETLHKHPLFNGADAKYTLHSIFIAPENKEQLIARITKRARMSKNELKIRISNAKKELAYSKKCNLVVINHEGKLKKAVAEIKKHIT